MTTYQDPPLQSRRAARQGERAEAATTIGSVPDSSDSAARAIADGTAEPLHYETVSRPPLPQYDGHDLRPRRTVESADHSDLTPAESLPDQDAPSYRSRDFSPEGRSAAAGWARPFGGVRSDEVGSDGVVDFQTQWRENVPVEVTPGIDPVPTPAGEAGPAPTDVAALSPAEHTMTRRELRALREAGLITDVTDLSQPIHLPVMPEPVAEPAAEAQPDDEAQPVDVIPAEIPAAVSPIADPIPLVAPAPQTSSRLDSALAEFDALAAGREPAVTSPDAPAPLTGRRAAASPVEEASAPPEAEAEVSTEPSAEAQTAGGWEFAAPEPLPPSTEGLSAFDALFQPPSAAMPVVVALPLDDDVVHHDVVQAELEPDSTSAVDEALASAPAPSTAAQLLAPPDPLGARSFVPPPPMYPGPSDLSAPPAMQAPAAVAEHSVSGPTVGHWSTQADIDDAEQLNDATISRSLGTGNGAITTSALVLPSVPDHSLSGPIGEGGEFLLTGSISLPDSLSVTGALPSQLEQPDIDHLLDPGDHQVASTDSTPVRAIRAVSTHTASGGIISPTKPKGTRGFTILIIAASTMALVVVGLLIAGLATGTL